MLQEIYRVLNEKQKSGELARLQKEAVERGKHSIENPKAVQGLSRVEKARFFYWDPTVRVPKTISDPNGNVIAEAGKTVNPLDYVNLPQNMLFFDGSDPAQVASWRTCLNHQLETAKASPRITDTRTSTCSKLGYRLPILASPQPFPLRTWCAGWDRKRALPAASMSC